MPHFTCTNPNYKQDPVVEEAPGRRGRDKAINGNYTQRDSNIRRKSNYCSLCIAGEIKTIHSG